MSYDHSTVHACTVVMIHARTMIIVHQCSMIVVSACDMIIVHYDHSFVVDNLRRRKSIDGF